MVNQHKKFEYDTTNIYIIKRYEYKDKNSLLDKINSIIIKDDLYDLLYIEDDLLLMS